MIARVRGVRPWLGQPQDAVGIDLSHQAFAGGGPVAALLPWAGLRDPIGGGAWVPFGTPPALGAGQRGLAVDSSAAFGGLYLSPSRNAATAAQTHLVVVEGLASAGGYSGLIGTTNAAASATSLSLQRDAPNTGWRTYPGYTALSTSLGAVFDPVALALTGDASGSAVWIDGVQSATNVMAPTARADSRIVLLGEQALSASYAYRGRIYLYVGWARRLPDDLLAEITRDPWKLTEPRRILVPVSVAGGGTYTDSITDSAAGTDAASSSLFALHSLSDSAAATDTVTGSTAATEPTTDSASGTDTASALLTVTQVIADAAAATDTTTDSATITESLSDSAAATDTATDAAALVESLSDSVAATDAATGEVGVKTYNESIADSATATDELSSVADLSVALSDSAAATDAALAGAQEYTESLSDSAAVADDWTRAVSVTEMLSDAAVVSDVLGSTAILSVLCEELAAGSDIVVVEGGIPVPTEIYARLASGDARRQRATRTNVQAARRTNVQAARRGN